jgi:hypothetical protein
MAIDGKGEELHQNVQSFAKQARNAMLEKGLFFLDEAQEDGMRVEGMRNQEVLV